MFKQWQMLTNIWETVVSRVQRSPDIHVNNLTHLLVGLVCDAPQRLNVVTQLLP
jgi:hypothetical protein